eukprot:CAMPEP_0183359440 /NCGR_PEP_ID=MMETSP0164_2-20130417/52212_1 /TAXON_ID=221442 /ORGANISM="Coccolithus pelagicus ssp braarudi, Strain PLY182g" /LENGTH=221 /DNA_ID=CAMNT_0025533549 /DNA_START=25 /DNA_END=690 /DNA_ORIENTATION=+
MAASASPLPATLPPAERYNPSLVPTLEAHVRAQCDHTVAYDVDANLALLKLYQLNPHLCDVLITGKVLALALMQLPATDYLLATYLVPERVSEGELLAPLREVANLLESCTFRQVWAALEPIRSTLLDAVPGFDAALREYMLTTMQITYQAIPEAHLRASLGLSAEEVAALLAARGWTLEGGVVKVTLNQDNQAKPHKVDDRGLLRREQMSKILSSIGASQ